MDRVDGVELSDDLREVRRVARRHLRASVLWSLRAQGFRVRHGRLVPPDVSSKEAARQLHGLAVSTSVASVNGQWASRESRYLANIANGSDVDVPRISPKLIEVRRGSREEDLFYYARLHWSIPTSRGYGRRLRFVVMDAHNDKLIGILGLADPVFALKDRDNWIGWDATQRAGQLNRVLDAYVLGAVPPYSFLLGGKLMALVATCQEVREAFARKYGNSTAVISGRRVGADPLLITTASAMGRSSLYNRLLLGDRLAWEPVGWTQGTGDVAFSNGLYAQIAEHAERWCVATARNERWGLGFRNRREVIKKALADVGLSPEWVFHGIRRQLFAAPLASNTRQVLMGVDDAPAFYNSDFPSVVAWHKSRWLLPRARSNASYAQFDRESYRLWPATA